MRLSLLAFVILSFCLITIYLVDKGHRDVQSSNVSNKLKRTNQILGPKDDPFTPRDNYYRYKKQRRQAGYKKLDAPEQYAILERERRIPNDRFAPEYPANHKVLELRKAKTAKSRNLKGKELDFVERGPSNVAGRTRALLILPGDRTKMTWLAGTATGGIWKTEDGGQDWVEKTGDFPNISTNTLAMSEADPNIIYAGTGEHFTRSVDGSGMFKSEDQGETWTQIVSPGDYDAFKNVSRILVDPNDANIVIATTRNSVYEDSLRAAIYKSLDGGLTWEQKLFSTEDRYDDLAFEKGNFNIIYVGVRYLGVIKSVDAGETWNIKSNGLSITGRIEIATSNVDTNYVWGFAQGGESGSGSDLYISVDKAETWKLVLEEDDEPIDFFSGQGWYDNVIESHPFERDIVYVGGINVFRINLLDREVNDATYQINDLGAFDFLEFINGTRIGGGILEGNLEPEEVVSIELRFGQGGQKAHRFSVSGAGAGVPATGYRYQDYVDIPFQAWDITNNRQLMVSFRDQQDDGMWTLKGRTLSAANTSQDSREYIFVHDVDYRDTQDSMITVTGGQEFRQLYFMWPVLKNGAQFDPDGTEASAFEINVKINVAQASLATAITDAYNEFNGNNSFSSSEVANNKGHHPDQHSLQFIIRDTISKQFSLLTTNDGGVYRSEFSTNPGQLDNSFSYAGFHMNTSQFYGADKMTGEDRYIGGMQDNGTWMSPPNSTGSAESPYQFSLGGDGFEVIWNNRNPNLILGSIQFNSFRRSTDRGTSWDPAVAGLDDDGPFISRLANSRALPDRVFTVGSSGVWVSENFGESWTSTPIRTKWSFNNGTDIEVSPANSDVVIAGGALDEFERIFVSTDAGVTFNPTEYYKNVELGTTSGLALHPEEDSTAYALFSFARRPKVLRTTDLGSTWEDISGFEDTKGISERGFPDVAVKCLLVFPNDPSRIWVGSEIGIIESLDNGLSWTLLDNNMPAVNVYDMKIQDDQIVIATYGRGIWSVQVEGIERAHFFPPNLTQLSVAPNENLNFQIQSPNEFDSIQLFVQDIFLGSVSSPIRKGQSDFILGDVDIEDGVYDFFLIGYKDGIGYKSLKFRSAYFDPLPPVREYFNDFSEDSLLNDFIGEGFSIRLEQGFQNPAIHSRHNYQDRLDIFYQLKRPIIVSEDQVFKYRDVAIVEIGISGAPFGSQDFFDFVVVEGSSNGISWKALEPGYDSSSDPDWELVYLNQANVTSNLYKDHEIDLKNTFSVNDTIFIRYRLSADPFVTGWGWAIDDVEIENLTTTPVFDEVFEALSIYPSPASEFVNIEIPDIGGLKMVLLYDLQGRLLFKEEIPLGKNLVQIPVTRYYDGIYFLEIYNEQQLIASEKVVVVK